MNTTAMPLALLIVLAAGFASAGEAPVAGHADAIQPLPSNPRYWQFRGKPALLLGGSDDDNLFQWEKEKLARHLDLLASIGGNCIRNTMSARDAGNVQPFAQVNGRYDLNQWNEAYWQRFKDLLDLTAQRGIIVQVEFWDPWDTYAAQWTANPWNPANNITYTTENTRLAAAYAPPQYRNNTSVGAPHDFFMTVPDLHNDRLVLALQERFVNRVLSYTLQYGHVLYCVTNEIHPQYPPQWGWHWARHIRRQAAAAGRQVYITEMYWTFDFSAPQHKASLEQPEIYDYFEASQNSGMRDAEGYWRNLQFARAALARHPRPINNTKIYGADTGPVWAGKDTDAVERFWRNLIGGAASMRFHRPNTGLGLNELAQANIRSGRMLAEAFDVFRAEPDAEHRLLTDRQPNEAYASAIAGRQYAVFFSNGGSVGLDLSGAKGQYSVRWLDIGRSQWQDAPPAAAGQVVTLKTPGAGRWVALLTAVNPSR